MSDLKGRVFNFLCWAALLISANASAQFVQQGTKLVGLDASPGQVFQGSSVALSADGNTAIVGAPGDNADVGAAWAYTRSGGAWTQQGGKLVGTGAVGAAQQGYSVALSGDGNTAIVGGNLDNGGVGAAWVYTRSGGVWIQQGAKLVGTGAVGNAQQGISVALAPDGNTALIGGLSDNSSVGAVWVYTRSGGVWTQQGGKLVGTGAVGGTRHGASVALSADSNTALVGGWGDNGGIGAVWVYTRSGGVWAQQGGKLVGTGAVGPAQQGYSVALSADGNTAFVGGLNDNNGVGAAWVYTRSGVVWTQQGAKLVGTAAVGSARQGCSVALSADGNTAIVGGNYDVGGGGAAWVFTRSAGVWTQQGSKLVGTGALFGPQQGYSVALSADGDTAIIGGAYDNAWLGAAWLFTRTAGVWTQQGPKLVGTGSVGVVEQGTSVALSSDGNTAIFGGPSDNNVAGAGTGAAWVLTRSAGAWTQQGAKLVGTTDRVGAANQGTSVALSGDGNTAIIGGIYDSALVGAVWVFIRNGGVWTQQGSKLVGTGAVGGSHQGRSVALSADGNTAFVGGDGDDLSDGAAWAFTRSGGIWTQQGPKLVGTGAVGTAFQGNAVAISADGNTALVGGPRDNNFAGAVWVFTRSGGVWTQQGPKLVGTGAIGTTVFQGISVALSADGNTATIGGFGDNGNVGAAWVFKRSGGVWTQQGDKLIGTGAAGPARQGASVALSADGNRAIVGGPLDNGVDLAGVGAFWVFTRSGNIWTQHGAKVVGTGAAGNASQGGAVALSADASTALVGGSSDASGRYPWNAMGAAWVFVQPGVATHFLISAPTNTAPGGVLVFTVTALDLFNNPVTDYNGTVHFSSSDGGAILPPDTMLTNGVGTFSATLSAAGGNQTITVTDTLVSSITGTSASILGTAPAAVPASDDAGLLALSVIIGVLGLAMLARRLPSPRSDLP